MPTRQPSQRSHKVGRLQHRSGLSPRPTFHNLFASLSITVFDSAEMECSLFGHSGFSLLDEGKSDTLSLGQGDEGLLALPDHENVTETGSEGVASGILDVGNLVGTGMVLDVLEDTNTTDIVSALHEDGGTVLELDDAVDLTSLKVQSDGIVLLDVRVGEANGSSVVGNNVRNLVLSKTLPLNLAELERGLVGVDSMRLEAALDVVEDSKVLSSLVNGNNVHESEREAGVSPCSVVNLDVGVLVSADLQHFLAGECVVKSLAEQNRHGDALT